MKQFLIQFILFFIGVIALLISVNLLDNSTVIAKRTDYMGAMIDKHERIKNIKTPKIIFAGGSNLAFGINSEELEKELHVPIVNLGLHADLGLSFILEELKYSANKNDIVFISIEYFLNKNGNYRLKRHTGEVFSEANLYYDNDTYLDLKAFLEDCQIKFKHILKKKNSEQIKLTGTDIYSRQAFNKYGDVIAHLDRPNAKKLKDGGFKKYIYWDGIGLLNSFYEYAKTKNITVFYVFPNYPLSEYEKNKTAIKKCQSDIEKDLKFEVLNKPEDFVYDDSLFFDTVYHLNKNGRSKRTRKLLELIEKNNSVQQRIAKMSTN